MSKQATQTLPGDMDLIIKSLLKEKCILFLGPELYKTSNGSKSEQQQFFEKLAAEKQEKILSYNPGGFFLFKSAQDKRRILLEIVEFFEEPRNEDVIQKIAEIPFHTIVSINPDIALKTCFEKNNQPHSFEFFDKKNKKEIAEPPTKEKPLLYNLFGSVTKDDTLILTHDDLFKYFKAIMGNNVLPLELRSALEDTDYYIFLGFQFDKWYLQLLLSLLKLNDETYGFIRYASANALNKVVQTLCTNHFKIEFIDADTNLFVNDLHKKCKNEGILRDFTQNEGIRDALDDVNNNRINDIKQKIKKQQDLLNKVEQKFDYETDPMDREKYKNDMEGIKERIEEYEKELKILT